MRTPDTKPSGDPKAVDPKQRIGRALTRAYEPILEEPVPPTLAQMAERLDPPGAKRPERSLLDRVRRAISAARRLIAEALGRQQR
jgi:hypothetical protein